MGVSEWLANGSVQSAQMVAKSDSWQQQGFHCQTDRVKRMSMKQVMGSSKEDMVRLCRG